MRIRSIQRGEGLTLNLQPHATLNAGDRLHVRDTPERLKEYEQALGATLYGTGDEPVDKRHPLSAEGQQLAEIVVTENSLLHLRTISQTRFADRTGLVVLALHRARSARAAADNDLDDITLQSGDVLLVSRRHRERGEAQATGQIPDS